MQQVHPLPPPPHLSSSCQLTAAHWNPGPCHPTIRSAIHPIILCASYLVYLVSGVDLSFNPLSVSLARRMRLEWHSRLILWCSNECANCGTRSARRSHDSTSKNITKPWMNTKQQTKGLNADIAWEQAERKVEMTKIQGVSKKSFTTLKAHRNLYRGHTQRFELSKCSKTHRVLPRIVMVQCDFHW